MQQTDLDLKPSETYASGPARARILLLACGALAREIVDVIAANNLPGVAIQCLPAKWHNTPQLIVPGLRARIKEVKGRFEKIFVLYGDCGTGGQLDALIEKEGIERIAGPHCYAFYSGNAAFAARSDEDLRSFFLTDYLARHFDKLIWQGLALDQHPELRDDYFQHYRKLVYLAQTKDETLEKSAQDAARLLGLEYEYRFTGYGELQRDILEVAKV